MFLFFFVMVGWLLTIVYGVGVSLCVCVEGIYCILAKLGFVSCFIILALVGVSRVVSCFLSVC